MRFRRAFWILLAVVGTAFAGDLRMGASLGAGWFTAPTVSSQAEALRPSFVLITDGWMERGPLSLGLELSNNLCYQTRKPSSGLADNELIWLTSGVVLLGNSIEIPDFPAKVRLAFGGGGVHVLNQLDRGSQTFHQESWGPEFHLVCLWERELGPNGLVLIRLAGVYSSTFASEIQGAALRSAGDWSRVEFSMGWSWRG